MMALCRHGSKVEGRNKQTIQNVDSEKSLSDSEEKSKEKSEENNEQNNKIRKEDGAKYHIF